MKEDKAVQELPLKEEKKERMKAPSNVDAGVLKKKVEEKPKSCPTLEDLESMPLKTYEDYKNYNKAVRQRRKFTRQKDVEYLYAPLDLVPCKKVRITRTSNRGKPININLRKLEYAIWFRSPKGGYKDGDEILLPTCLIDEINNLSEPKYKQVKYPDGSHETVLDYWDNKYSVQTLHGDH